MSRKVGSTNVRTTEFFQYYDSMVEQYKDPVECLFRLLKARKQSVVLHAATTLISYRYPKQVAARIEIEQAQQIAMSWGEPPIEGELETSSVLANVVEPE